MLSVSDPIHRSVGKIASLAGLQVVCASCLDDVKFFANQRGIVTVMLEVNNCCDTFRIMAAVQEGIPGAPLILITEAEENAQDRLAVRLGASYAIRKPCHPAELDRLFRFILENYADEADCLDSMKQELTKHKATSLFSSSATTEELKSSGFLTLKQIKRRAIIATVSLANGDKMRAAKMLGVGKTTVYREFQANGCKRRGETLTATEGFDSVIAEGAD